MLNIKAKKGGIIIAILILAGVKLFSQSEKINTTLLMERCADAVAIIQHTEGSGTGFLIHEMGYVVTNYHVIEDFIHQPRRITVSFDGKQNYTVRAITLKDKHFDIAVLNIGPLKTTPLPLNNGSQIVTGNEVATIGHPFGIHHTINKGLISNTSDIFSGAMFQIDIPINPGNSGGPVLNANGQVLGIVTLRLESIPFVTPNFQNIAFAVRVDKLIELLLQKGIPFHSNPLIETAELKAASELTDEERLRQIEIRTKAAELEFLVKQRELESEIKLAELSAKQRQELQSMEFEQEKRRIEHKHRLERQKLDAELERAKIAASRQVLELQREENRLKQQAIEIEKESIKSHQFKKAYYAGLPGRFVFRPGGGAIAPGGVIEDFKSDPNTNWISGYMQLMMLYRFDINQNLNKKSSRGRGTALGVSYTSGTISKHAMLEYKKWQEITADEELTSSHWFNEYEVALLIREWFRLSMGYGLQQIQYINTQTKVDNYYNANIGFIGRISAFELELTGGVRFGNNLEREIWVIKLGASLHLPFAKF